MKKILTPLLVGLALAGAIAAVMKNVNPPAKIAQDEAAEASESTSPQLPADGIVVTYFTTDVRCPSCRQIESLTREMIESEFPDALASGHLVFQTINTDRPENAHYVKDYELVSKTVIVSRRQDGRETSWRNLQDVWLKMKEPESFNTDVAEAVRDAQAASKP